MTLHTEGNKARAQRYPINLPVKYRRRGDQSWHEGKTINFSRTGIYFRADREFPKDSLLELSIFFPEDMIVLCNGPVVRGEAPEFPETQPSLAIQIRHYHMTNRAVNQIIHN